jgi:hypothetical protein
MRMFLMLSLLSLSINAFAEMEIYSGNNGGASCELQLDIKKEYASLGNCGVLGSKKFKNDGKKIIIEGGAEFTDCKIEVTLSSLKVPTQASLSTKHLLKPFYTKAVVCKDLKRVR